MSKKWDRSLGTSKKEQGIATPPSAQHPKKRVEFLTGREAKGIYVPINKVSKILIGWK